MHLRLIQQTHKPWHLPFMLQATRLHGLLGLSLQQSHDTSAHTLHTIIVAVTLLVCEFNRSHCPVMGTNTMSLSAVTRRAHLATA